MGRGGIAMVLSALALPFAADAQDLRPFVGAGYVAGAPDLMGGAALYGAVPNVLGGLGLYVDAKFDIERPTEERGYEPDLTAEQVESEIGDPFYTSEDVWYNINVALVRPVSETLALYLGAGYASMKRYNEYQDEDGSGEFGFGGFYWAEDTAAERTEVNVIGGALFRIGSHINAQFGAERSPRGLMVGLSYILPF